MLRISAYADRLLDDLAKLEWPEKVKVMQANWIGRSQGAEILFKVEDAKKKVLDLAVFTTRADTLFGATYVVLAPEHELVEKITLPDKKSAVQKYIENARKVSDIDRTAETREKTGVFTGAYAVNPVNNETIPVWIADYVLVHYGTGAVMCVPAHDQRDFEFAKKFDLPIREVISNEKSVKDSSGELKEAYVEAGRMVNSGSFNGLDSEEAKTKIMEDLAKKGLAKTTVKYKLRDWIFSRQRYWGEPIPVVYCDKCGEVPLDEKDLPLLLPEVDKYQPSGTGKSPLANIEMFVNAKCPKCKGPAKRETDTMPQWAGSSWYFLRYPNAKLQSAAFDSQTVNRWLPVDCYVGGVEHAILHLLYARFFTKVLYDLGYLKFDEPFGRLFNQGMILKQSQKTGKLEKMSKSKGNVVNPDELVAKYGTDTIRMYELFVGPPELDSEWSDRGIEGVYKFLRRSWDWVMNLKDFPAGADDADTSRELHTLIYKITDRLETFKFNTAISAFMEFLNAVAAGDNKKRLSKKTLESFIILLAPFGPHIAEEMWEATGHAESVFKAKWPAYDKKMITTDTVELPVQVNGKLRGTLTISRDAPEEEVFEKALELEGVKKYTAGKGIKKKVYVREKIINLVV
jgi:leucyl-tRNA synthetase